MNAIGAILTAPAEAFEMIRNRPRWFLPAVSYVMVFFVIIWLGGCWQNMREAFRWSYLVGPALISPLIVTIVSLGTTAFLHLMNIIIGGEVGRALKFRTILSLNIHCAVIILFGEVVNFLLVHVNVPGTSEFPLPNRFPVGLDLILIALNESNVYAATVLHSTSCFVLWYLVVLQKGISVLTGSSGARSAFIVASLWVVAVVAALGFVYAAGGGTMIRIELS